MGNVTVRLCVNCDAPLTKKSGPGRWPRYCSDKCNPNARVARRIVAVTCGGCGEDVVQGPRTRNPKRWCSENCRQRVWAKANPNIVARQRERQSDRQKAITLAKNARQICTVCGDTFGSRWPRKYCSDRCKYRAYHVARYAARKGAERSPYDLSVVLAADSCGLCSLPIDRDLAYPDPLSASLDHIVPLSRGGSDSAENVQAAHLVCNQRKGARVT